MRTLDRSRVYCGVVGDPVAKYLQDEIPFDGNGNEIFPYPPVTEPAVEAAAPAIPAEPAPLPVELPAPEIVQVAQHEVVEREATQKLDV